MIQSVSKPDQEFRLESFLASKVVWRVLRVLLTMPPTSYGSTEMARLVGTSHAGATRALRRLEQARCCVKRGARYRANPDQAVVRYLWLLLQAERYRNLPPELVNAIDLVVGELTGADAVVLFGSWAHGVADETSDVDICLFGKGARSQRLMRQRWTFEIQAFGPDELNEPSRTVVLDALCTGITVRGADLVYDAASRLRSFPKSFLLARLARAQDFMTRSEDLTGPARDYYTQLAERTLRQIDGILQRGRTVARRERGATRSIDQLYRELSARLAEEGERVWLI
jgi:DNA-binding MarR family transcriptional regulator